MKLYKQVLTNFSNQLGKPFEKATEEDILRHNEGKSQSTKNYRIVVLRDFYRWHLNLDDHKPLPKFIRRIKPRKIKKNDIKYRQRVISEEEFQRLLDFATSQIHKAGIELLWATGGRKEAIQTIQSDGVTYDGEYTRITFVKDKTTEREYPYPGRLKHLLLWAEELQPFKGQKGKPLFAVSQHIRDKAGNIIETRYKQVHDQYLYIVIKRLCKRAGLRHIRTHDFRHTWITNQLKNGMPITHICSLAGLEKNSDVLKIYDHNKTKDYEEWMKDKKSEIKPTYELLEKQKETLEKKHEKKIEALKEVLQIVTDNMSGLANADLRKDLKDILAQI